MRNYGLNVDHEALDRQIVTLSDLLSHLSDEQYEATVGAVTLLEEIQLQSSLMAEMSEMFRRVCDIGSRVLPHVRMSLESGRIIAALYPDDDLVLTRTSGYVADTSPGGRIARRRSPAWGIFKLPPGEMFAPDLSIIEPVIDADAAVAAFLSAVADQQIRSAAVAK